MIKVSEIFLKDRIEGLKYQKLQHVDWLLKLIGWKSFERKEIFQKVKGKLWTTSIGPESTSLEGMNAYQIMNKSLNAQHAEIYKLQDHQSFSAAFARTSDNSFSTPPVDVSPTDAISADTTALVCYLQVQQPLPLHLNPGARWKLRGKKMRILGTIDRKHWERR